MFRPRPAVLRTCCPKRMHCSTQPHVGQRHELKNASNPVSRAGLVAYTEYTRLPRDEFLNGRNDIRTEGASTHEARSLISGRPCDQSEASARSRLNLRVCPPGRVGRSHCGETRVGSRQVGLRFRLWLDVRGRLCRLRERGPGWRTRFLGWRRGLARGLSGR